MLVPLFFSRANPSTARYLLIPLSTHFFFPEQAHIRREPATTPSPLAMLLSTFSSSSGNPLPPFPRPPLHSPTRPALRWGQPMGGTRDAARGGCEQSTRGSVPQASPLMQAKHRSYDGGRGVLEPAAGRAATGGVLPPATVGEPEVIWDKAAMRAWSRRRRAEGKTVVLVPTMGFLHEGHLSLVSAAAAVAGPVAVVVSIYVNPGQFARTEDFATYPSDLAGDLRKLASTGAVHAVFNPPDLYDRGAAVSGYRADASGGAACCVEAGSDGHETWIRVERLEKGLCGDSRPVFFRGVATVVAKLFNVVEPDVAMFGKKDYQQWRVICRMVRDLDFAIEVIGSEIVREADGLAMSSRNVRLSPEEREKALSISRSLVNARTAVLNNSNSASEHIKDHIVQTLTEAGGRVDYIEIVEQESLVPVETIDRPVVICVAAWFGKVRLIDNIEIHSQS